MKVRNDFVTNSSSASYILGNSTDTQMTVESTYQLVRQIYLEALGEFKRIIDDNKEVLAAAGATVEWEPDHNYRFKYNTDDNRPDPECHRLLWELLGSEYDSFSYMYTTDYSWLNCETYEEYLNYYDDDVGRVNGRVMNHPFYIFDFAEDVGSYWDVGEAVEWYDIDIDPTYLANIYFDGDCEKCLIECKGRYEGEGWCEEQAHKMREKCRSMKQKIENGTAEKLLLNFGKIMISSDHELNMPWAVHQRLEKIAVYGCCHMG